MMMSRHSFLNCTSLLTFAALSCSAHAVPILSTNSQFSVGGTLVAEDPASGPPPATIGSLVTTSQGSSVDFVGDAFARAAATSGVGAVRADGVFFSGSGGDHELQATARFGETITNATGATQSYFYDFNVAGPLLEIDDYVFGPDATIRYSIQIQFNGLTIWDSAAELFGGQVSGSSGAFTLTQTGTNLGATFFCLTLGCSQTNTGSRFGYTFGDFSDRLQLGSVPNGDSFTLETIMNVSVSAPPFEMGGLALIGDPSNIGTDPGISGSVGIVPVPAAVWLFGSGLIGLIAVARRKAA